MPAARLGHPQNANAHADEGRTSIVRLSLSLFLVAVAIVFGAADAQAQSEVDLFGGGFGTSSAGPDADTPEPGTRMQPGEGALAGRIFNADTGSAIRGVTVILQYPSTGPDTPQKQEVGTTDSDGAYEFPSVPPGRSYSLSFVKSGFRTSAMTGVEVMADQLNRSDFPMPPLAVAETGAIMDLEAFVVNEAVAGQMVQNLELRLESDSLVNLMSAEDLSRFAASDVADALKRVAGVNIVEGQFAIIRGLEDRYSSTTFNRAPVPSPDPDRQSVQLDLFPSEIVNNIGVFKTFTPDLPSNSAGGSIDIFTLEYPDELTFKVNAAAGFNTNALDEFLEYTPDNPVGQLTDGKDTVEMEFGGLLGGRWDLFRRELRAQGIFNYETDYRTAIGFQETLQPRDSAQSTIPSRQRNGGLLPGLLNNSGSRYDLTQSSYSEQWTGYGAIGFDLDEEAHHKIDTSVFYSKVNQEVVQARDNGWIYGLEVDDLIEQTIDEPDGVTPNLFIGPIRTNLGDDDLAYGNTNWFLGSSRDDLLTPPGREGGAWFAPNSQSQSFERERDLLITQLNGAHVFPGWNGFTVDWAANWARTKQDETSRRLRYFYEPNDIEALLQPDGNGNIPLEGFVFPTRPEDLGPGQWVNQVARVLWSGADVVESQGFGRVDLGYEWDVSDDVLLDFGATGWYERAKRDVEAFFLETASAGGGNSEAIAAADTPYLLGFEAFDILATDPSTGDIIGVRDQTNNAVRQIGALGLNGKATLFEDWDVFAGVRLEHITIETTNDPFTGELNPDGTVRTIFGAPNTFPQIYLFGDRLDNPNDRTGNNDRETSGPPPPDVVYNDQLLGIDQPPNNFVTENCNVTGVFCGSYVDRITEAQILDFVNQGSSDWYILPSLSAAWRFYEGAALRFAYSETVARPSLREVGYYVSVEPGSDDLIVGNPTLGVSEVRSVDGRVEYSWGDFGDLVAFSAFWKQIENPIESLIVQNPLDTSLSSSAFYRTFFNNPNNAKLWGIEAEARKNLGIAGFELGELFSVGGNFTWIDARVRRSEVEARRFDPFFLDAQTGELENTLIGDRRLFGQPKWIANADITFDQDDWGTMMTLAFFAISDVLDAAGSSQIGLDGRPTGVGVIDRYVDGFYQLDFVVSQRLDFDFIPGDLALKMSAKNLTDSKRGIVYDSSVTSVEYFERQFRVGRDFKFSVTYVW